MGKYFLLKENTFEEVEIVDTYTEAEMLLKCDHLDFATCPGGYGLIVDDSGVIKGRPVNNIASSYYRGSGPICGDAILCKYVVKYGSGEFASFKEDELFDETSVLQRAYERLKEFLESEE